MKTIDGILIVMLSLQIYPVSAADSYVGTRADLRVWKDGDGNGNGFVGEGELLSLADVGVQNLGADFSQQNTTDAQGNQHLEYFV